MTPWRSLLLCLKMLKSRSSWGIVLPGLPPRCCPRTPTGPWWPPAPQPKLFFFWSSLPIIIEFETVRKV